MRSKLPWKSLVLGSEGAATAEIPAATSLAALLTRHLLRDGELVILILKPSIWFIPLSSIGFAAIVLIVMILARLGQLRGILHINTVAYVEAGLFLIAARLMWA